MESDENSEVEVLLDQASRMGKNKHDTSIISSNPYILIVEENQLL